jgi:hypothetical protein
VIAPRLGAMRCIEALLLPDNDVQIVFHLDRVAKGERDARRRGGAAAGTWPR